MSISLILDNNGIIKRSKDARREYGQAKENEQADLNKVSEWIDKQANGNEETKTVPGWENKKDDNATINGGKGNANNPTIPAGYVPINTDTSNWGDGSTAPSQDSVDHGLVIRDDSNNEWVWIPVPDVTVMCDISNQTEYTLCGIAGETAVKANRYSKSEIISGQKRTTPGTTTDPYYREPDLVVGYEAEGYDTAEEHYKDVLGFNSKEKMAEAFVEDYNEMIASISKYGGFYIGRYELSSEGVQKDKETLTGQTWYDLYQKCRMLNASKKVETRMIWGCQWDVTMNWLISSGAKTSEEVNSDSSSWGNYRNTSVKADDGTTELKASGTNQVLNTGVTTFTMSNNIYDLAGNCWEWTQEAKGTGSRTCKGGESGSDGSAPASYNNINCPMLTIYVSTRYSSNFNNKVTRRV